MMSATHITNANRATQRQPKSGAATTTLCLSTCMGRCVPGPLRGKPDNSWQGAPLGGDGGRAHWPYRPRTKQGGSHRIIKGAMPGMTHGAHAASLARYRPAPCASPSTTCVRADGDGKGMYMQVGEHTP